MAFEKLIEKRALERQKRIIRSERFKSLLLERGIVIFKKSNDPKNHVVDSLDIRRILQAKINKIDIKLVKEYFKLFDKESLLNEWLREIEQ